MKVGVVLASHGNFAAGSLDTIKFILGEADYVETICIAPDDETESIKNTMAAKCKKLLRENEHVIIMTDILCGTPCNVATQLFLTYENISIIAGYNIPILLELFSMRSNENMSIEELLASLKESFSSSYRVFVKEKREEV